jgi:ABC-type transport system substrate-binding protein
MYEKMTTMSPSPERTALIEKMRDRVVEDSPYIGSMARSRYYLIHPWLKNFKPTEIFYNWVKYMDIAESKR